MRHRILLFILFVVCSAFLYGQENILICSKQVSNSVDRLNEILQKNEAYISVDFVDINLDKILEYEEFSLQIGERVIPIRKERIDVRDTVLKTKLFGLKVRHFNNPCLLIAFTRSIHALFSM